METARFDASEVLETPARRAAYLSAALETGDPEEIRDALGIVARARGLAEVTRRANLSRTSPTKPLGETAIRSSALSCACLRLWAFA
jgi:probable addiction module antidote protein